MDDKRSPMYAGIYLYTYTYIPIYIDKSLLKFNGIYSNLY